MKWVSTFHFRILHWLAAPRLVCGFRRVHAISKAVVAVVGVRRSLSRARRRCLHISELRLSPSCRCSVHFRRGKEAQSCKRVKLHRDLVAFW
ncbi:hypothetical protein I3760_02G052700 [Carya illinoinensis]|nr:hypothetical protein I3760_02G052700 [Carya illinoinensis]